MDSIPKADPDDTDEARKAEGRESDKSQEN
jgi:hypothetical protein